MARITISSAADLTFAGKKILQVPDCPRHMEGSSLVFLDGFYYLVTANSFLGDVIMMKFDIDWNFKESRMLRPMAHWSTGLVFAQNRFYLAYLDTSRRQPGMNPFPIYLNVHLAAFDRDWNLIEDVAVTDFSTDDRHLAGRPGLLFFGHRLYVAYDVATITPDNQELLDGQVHVSVYDLPDDADGDGIIGTSDACPASDLRNVIFIKGCNSGVPNRLFPTGCTISDEIARRAEGAKNHGEFANSVAHYLIDLVAADVISGAQKDAIQSCVAKAR